EFLMKYAADCLLEGNEAESRKTIGVVKKFYSKGSLLREEFSLFKVLMDSDVKSEKYVAQLIDEVCASAKRIDSRALDMEKSKLIKEINHNLKGAQAIFDKKVTNYPVYASMQVLFDDSRGAKRINESFEGIRMKD